MNLTHERSTRPQGGVKPNPIVKSDIATILAKIDDIAKEIRGLRRAPPPPRRTPHLEEAELTSVQKQALQVLAERGEMTSSEVAEALNRTRPLMVTNLNQLVALGVVEKERKGKRVYFRRKRPETSGVIGEAYEGGGCCLFAVLVSDDWPVNVENLEHLISEHLKDIPDWRVEHVVVLPRPLAEESDRAQG